MYKLIFVGTAQEAWESSSIPSHVFSIILDRIVSEDDPVDWAYIWHVKANFQMKFNNCLIY